MHIPIPKNSKSDAIKLIGDLEILTHQPSAVKSPPCPGCDPVMRKEFEDANCNCECSRAPMALSEDPERYPIEPHVVPLVFELTCLRLVQTCWSCEGHLDIDGKLWKLPQVSYYSVRPIYSQLICNYLSRLYWRRKLSYPWEVSLTNYGRSWDVTYTIKCDMTRVPNPDIYKMQNDLMVMAKDFSENIKYEAGLIVRDIAKEWKL